MAGYGTGQIRIYEAVTGILHAEVNAHARWIYSLDIAPFSGLVSYFNQIVVEIQVLKNIQLISNYFIGFIVTTLLVCFSFSLLLRTLLSGFGT